MAYDKNRPRPTAYVGEGGHPKKRIVLSTGRGDIKLTPDEARELAEELTSAARYAGMGAQVKREGT